MTYYLRIMEAEERGRIEGKEQQKAIAETEKRTAVKKLLQSSVDVEIIAASMNMTLEEIIEIQNESDS